MFLNKEKQIEILQKGTIFTSIEKPATIGDGIFQLNDSEQNRFISKYLQNKRLSVQKFVPASGAATRMFKFLYEFVNEEKESDELHFFQENLKKFPFYSEQISGKNLKEIIRQLLFEEPFRFSEKPKAFIPFHKYGCEVRNALEEHISESLQLNTEEIHFTISPHHEHLIKTYLKQNIKITYSYQNPETDTFCVDENGNVVTNENGEPFRRPAGHGALLENINRLSADLIFIKNIDNIQPERTQPLSVRWKRVIGGLLMQIIELRNSVLEKIKEGNAYNRSHLAELGKYFPAINQCETIEDLKSFLNRPLRVAGMVKNTGAPGGGPFWVRDRNGNLSLQIVEKSQIDLSNPQQKQLLEQATHFNPVDMVIHIKDFEGKTFDLTKYRDDNACFISEKTYKGKPIKALEMPGLWNGSMADWLTVFVEIPSEIFTPVKTVNDLLSPGHQT